MKFIEICSNSNENINEAFEMLAKDLLLKEKRKEIKIIKIPEKKRNKKHCIIF